ncbi:MAG: nitroreductase family protein [Acidimicrobiia bacterium]|nr:nitroreductase family protein [Acidimicrobiia bacterium]NNF09909.1 nitroreductase family protein [Acidimicrobiia bacterium]NNL70536.1 nitroreductase family protein [Acidimicrobiia bacterium]
MSIQLPDDPYDAVVGLRTVRKYAPRPVSDEDRDAILEAGRWTGSAKNRQDWLFLVVDEPAVQAQLADCGRFSGPLRDARLVIVPIRLPGGYEFDIGRVSQNMMLAAFARGVGSCPVTMHDEACAAAVLGVPADHGVRYALCFGYPDDAAEKAARAGRGYGGRKPLDELIRHNRF